MPRERKFVASLAVQYALFFCIGLNISRNLPLPFGVTTMPFIPQSVTSHCDILLLTKSGHLCNLLVRKLLGKRTRYSKWIFSRLHQLDALTPTLGMDFFLYENVNEVRLSIPQQLPPFLMFVNFDNNSLMKIQFKPIVCSLLNKLQMKFL